MASSVIKDLALIGAVGAAGYLGFKLLTDKLPSISLPGVSLQQDTQQDYAAVDKFADLLAQNNAQQNALISSVLQQIANKPNTVTVITSDPGDGGNPTPVPTPVSTSDLTGYADTATMALEKIGAYGSIRQAEAEVAETYDKNNTAAVNALGGLGGIVGFGNAETSAIASGLSSLGATPGAAGAGAAAASTFTDALTGNGVGIQRGIMAVAPAIKSVGEDVYDFFKGLF